MNLPDVYLVYPQAAELALLAAVAWWLWKRKIFIKV